MSSSNQLLVALAALCFIGFLNLIVNGLHYGAECPRDTVPAAAGTAPVRAAAASANCPDTNSLVLAHCSTPESMGLCFDVAAEVETLLLLENRTSIFAALKALEPQEGQIFYWAVDENTAAEDSHLDTDVRGTAEYFDNNAYYYSVERHAESVRCGAGWSLGFWKTSQGQRSLQLAYCEESETNVRVCGAFDVVKGVN